LLIEEGNVDLVLWIFKCQICGLQLSKKNCKAKQILFFTTAYPQFAIQSYEVDAIDYLLKPFEFERFMTVLKVKKFSA
jgi:DNA-binding LytR/AlgR family response regulator